MERQRLRWLGLTAEPERDLPSALAALRAGGPPAAASVLVERRNAERVVLRGNERSWLRYLHGAAELVPDRPPADPQLRAAAVVVAEVVLNHHRLLAGLPGPAYDSAAAERHRMHDFLDKARAHGGAE